MILLIQKSKLSGFVDITQCIITLDPNFNLLSYIIFHIKYKNIKIHYLIPMNRFETILHKLLFNFIKIKNPFTYNESKLLSPMCLLKTKVVIFSPKN